MLLRPGLLEPPDGCGRQSAGVLAEQCDQRLLEVSCGYALEIEDRDQHLQALRPARIGRQNRRRKADALRTFADAVTHARAAHGDRADAGHDLAFRQMSVARQPRMRTVAQNLGQRIGKSSSLGELEDVSVGHGVSLLRWRSGRLRTPPRYAALPLHAVTNFRP